MGYYLYINSPSKIARALVEIDGAEQEVEVALYRYAYKPYQSGGRRENQRMHFRSGATSCEQAWERVKREQPKFGAMYSDEPPVSVPNPASDGGVRLFLSNGPVVADDFVKDGGAKVIRWLSLPKGMRVAEPRRALGSAL
jgi:hypothetical protein